MPIHDWTRVNAGTWHAFHLAWIAELQRSLNGGLLPPEFYALGEQRVAKYEGDLLTLERVDREHTPRHGMTDWPADQGGVAVAEPPPLASVVQEFARRPARVLAIRHATGDRVVALLEIISPGNKDRPESVTNLVEKAVDALSGGLHVGLVDLFPPGPGDPRGLPDAMAARLGRGRYDPPAGRALSLASYQVAEPQTIKAYIEPAAVGEPLAALPLFYEPSRYVRLPLEETYRRAWEGVPQRFKRVLEGDS
jgi:hypothetical protein